MKYQQLLGASNSTGFEKEDWEIAAEAIDDWFRRHHPDPIPMPATKGYQWKGVFLPDGTLLRTVFGSGTALSPLRRLRGNHRRSSADDPVAALMRETPLPLLYRMCA